MRACFSRPYCQCLCRRRMEATEKTTAFPQTTSSPGGQATLETVDIVVLVIYFLLILAVGFWVSLSRLATYFPVKIKPPTQQCKQWLNVRSRLASGFCNNCWSHVIVSYMLKGRIVRFYWMNVKWVSSLNSGVALLINKSVFFSPATSPCAEQRAAQSTATFWLERTWPGGP